MDVGSDVSPSTRLRARRMFDLPELFSPMSTQYEPGSKSNDLTERGSRRYCVRHRMQRLGSGGLVAMKIGQGPVHSAENVSEEKRETSKQRVEGTRKRSYRYVDWATLLSKTFDFDVLSCQCGGRFKAISVITDPGVVERILNHFSTVDSEGKLLRCADTGQQGRTQTTNQEPEQIPLYCSCRMGV